MWHGGQLLLFLFYAGCECASCVLCEGKCQGRFHSFCDGTFFGMFWAAGVSCPAGISCHVFFCMICAMSIMYKMRNDGEGRRQPAGRTVVVVDDLTIHYCYYNIDIDSI